jgi:hypothetical protein
MITTCQDDRDDRRVLFRAYAANPLRCALRMLLWGLPDNYVGLPGSCRPSTLGGIKYTGLAAQSLKPVFKIE